ncbi:MAG: tetratricopeptide repeat protein [Candidatus Eisenbacteria bacterium]|nr:tetratricopeptide repeat protein [Candidatus Eisenbacteria bacterium]
MPARRVGTRAMEPGDLGWLTLVVVAAALTACHALLDPDLWFHLRAGREMAQGSGIPRADTFSYVSAGQPYIDLHWLYQAISYQVYRLGGANGIICLQMLVAAATFGGLYRLARLSAPPAVAGFLSVAAVALCAERSHPRPEAWSFLLLVGTQVLAAAHAKGSRRTIWMLPALFAFWANIEGVFVVGLVTLGGYALTRPQDRRLWLTLGLSGLATLANPYLLEGSLHPFVLFSRINRSLPVYSQTIGEFLSPFHGEALHLSMVLFPAYLALIGVLLLTRRRRPELGHLLLLAAFIYLAVSARRNVALLPLIATPILALWWRESVDAARAHRAIMASRGWRWLCRVAPLCAVALVLRYDLAVVTNQINVAAETNARFGFGLAPCAFPVEAARFARAQRLPGPYFATMAAGDFLLFDQPAERQFIDGRLEVHTEAHYAQYLSIIRGGDAWRAAQERFRFRTLVLPTMEAPALLAEVSRDPGWAWVYADDTAAVFLRRDAIAVPLAEVRRESVGTPPWRGATPLPAPGPTIPALLDPRPRAIPWAEMNHGQLFLIAGWPEVAATLLSDAVRTEPECAAPRISLASAAAQLGDLTTAEEQLVAARRLPRSDRVRSRALSTEGFVLLSRNRPREAIGAYTAALRIMTAPDERGPALINLGLARLLSDDREGAYRDVVDGLRLVPSYVDGYRILGGIEERRGNADGARRAFETYIGRGGRNPAVTEALRRLGGE